jgi:hypothetical protein
MDQLSDTLVDGELMTDSVDTFGRRFEDALVEFARHGIDEDLLRTLAAATKEIDRDLDRLYAGKFPKTCNTCGRTYETRDEYLAATSELRMNSTFFDSSEREVQEYRDCACGSSLLVLLGDRRDDSPWGRRRRQAFDLWLKRLARDTRKPSHALAPLLRQVFRAALARAREGV